MRKLVYKILVLILIISFTAEIATPLFRNYCPDSLLMETQETDEKKDNDKKEKEEETKDKSLSNIKFFSLIEIVTDFHLKNDLENTLGFLSLPEMPPDQV
jgi:predicted lipid-binding transport protein (Tim44 family)